MKKPNPFAAKFGKKDDKAAPAAKGGKSFPAKPFGAKKKK
jgi:hypothetical protein